MHPLDHMGCLRAAGHVGNVGNERALDGFTGNQPEVLRYYTSRGKF